VHPTRRSQSLKTEQRESETLVEGLLRKEVIQPHLPIRLPCYDLAPVISPTFGGSVLFRLGHRLRVLPTPMA
jgi:hypothetical protein